MSRKVYAVCAGSTDMYKQVHAGMHICILYFSVYKFTHYKTPSCKVSAFSLFSGLSPLHLAVQRDHKDLAKMLLDAGGDINAMVSPCAALTQHRHHNITNLPSLHFLKFFLCHFCL